MLAVSAGTVTMCSRQLAALCAHSIARSAAIERDQLTYAMHVPLFTAAPDLRCAGARRRGAGEPRMLTAGGRCNPCVTQDESAVSAKPQQTTSRKHTRETGTFICPHEGEHLATRPCPLCGRAFGRGRCPSYRSGASQNAASTPSAPCAARSPPTRTMYHSHTSIHSARICVRRHANFAGPRRRWWFW